MSQQEYKYEKAKALAKHLPLAAELQPNAVKYIYDAEVNAVLIFKVVEQVDFVTEEATRVLQFVGVNEVAYVHVPALYPPADVDNLRALPDEAVFKLVAEKEKLLAEAGV